MNRQLTTEEIAQRAYELYVERGRQPGHEAEDWLRAESELKQRYSIPAATVTVSPAPVTPAKPSRSRGTSLGLGRKRIVTGIRNSLS